MINSLILDIVLEFIKVTSGKFLAVHVYVSEFFPPLPDN